MLDEIMIKETLNDIKKEFSYYEEICLYNSQKVLDAFHKYNLSYSDFSGTTGYGYGDIGRDKVEQIFSYVLGADDSIVRKELVSGTHAISIMLFGILNHGELLLSITGTPYDTLHEVIGIKDNKNSLISKGIKYQEIDLINDDFNYEEIKNYLDKKNPKVIYIQRSIGYSTRESINIGKISKIIKFIKNINSKIIIAIDNCYTEFVEKLTPLEVGADLIVGSLIKNLGGGIAPSGGYIAGKKSLIRDISDHLYAPGLGKEIGSSMDMNKFFLKGLYDAPSAVLSSLKVVTFASRLLERCHIKAEPKYNEIRSDVVLKIYLENESNLVKFVNAIQKNSAIDSSASIIPDNMAGYDAKIAMASGSFVSGSSIELSCDSPLREPYVAYLQGSIHYEYGYIAIINAIKKILKG